MRKTLTIALLFSLVNGTEALDDWQPSGARSQSMGGMTAACYDTWSAENNPAGLAWLTRTGAGLYFADRFLLEELSDKAVAAGLPFRFGTFGVALHHYGFTLYNEVSGKVSFARKFGHRLAAGVTLEYLRVHTGDDYGNRNVATFSVGLQYKASETFLAGIHLLNPVPVSLLHGKGPLPPTIIRMGLTWTFIKNASAGIEVEKEINRKPAIKGGFEYQAAKPLILRAGISTEPVTFSFGAGIEAGGLRIDISSSYHWVLGYSPQVSVVYLFKSRER